MKVLDFGAGRGSALHEDPCDYRRELQRLQGKVASIVGVDIDDEINKHPSLDEINIIKIGETLPYSDSTFDLIVSDYVFEHIDEPKFVVKELERVLKPGGWLCARTPNRWGYIGIGARLIPNKLHAPLAKILQGGIREKQDVFPTRYLLNTLTTLRKYFQLDIWEHFSYTINPEPAYFGNSKFLWGFMFLWSYLTPRALDSVLLIFLRKKSNI